MLSDLDDDLQVDLTPLIDVTFMLIIFFITTMSFTLPVIDFSLPESETAVQSERSQDTVRIFVSSSGDFRLASTPVDRSAIIAALKSKDTPVLELIIAADAPAQRIVDAADLAREYCSGRMVLITENHHDQRGN